MAEFTAQQIQKASPVDLNSILDAADNPQEHEDDIGVENTSYIRGEVSLESVVNDWVEVQLGAIEEELELPWGSVSVSDIRWAAGELVVIEEVGIREYNRWDPEFRFIDLG